MPNHTMQAPRSAARSQTLIRRINELAFINAGRGSSALTLREISSRTGQSWRTTNIVAETLTHNGWLIETPATDAPPGPGRPARHFAFNAAVGHVLGLEVSVSHIDMALTDLEGTPLSTSHTEVPASLTAEQRLEATRDAIHKILDTTHVGFNDIWAAAAGTSGVISDDGHVRRSDTIANWTGLDLQGRLESMLGCTVVVENDCNLAALAEIGTSVADRNSTIIYLFTGQRLGTGIIIDGNLYRGHRGLAGEVGAVAELAWGEAPDVLASSSPHHQPAEVLKEAGRGEKKAIAAVDKFVETLGLGIAAMTLSIDPDAIVIGGGFAFAFDLIAPRLKKILDASFNETPKIVPSSVANQPVAFGGVHAALDLVSRRIANLDPDIPLLPSNVIPRSH